MLVIAGAVVKGAAAADSSVGNDDVIRGDGVGVGEYGTAGGDDPTVAIGAVIGVVGGGSI